MPQPRSNRPRALGDVFVSGTPERFRQQVLTPRTPHSRSGRAEEGFTEYELQHLNEEDEDEEGSFLSATPVDQQSARLLAPTGGPAFPPGYRSRGDDHEILSAPFGSGKLGVVVRRVLLVSASLMACAMLAMFMMAFKPLNLFDDDPLADILDAPLPADRLISYANYTHFPLSGSQYRHECENLGRTVMRHNDYWAAPLTGPLDAPHPQQVQQPGKPSVCLRSVTYLLDGHVGLATDLALMAQVAQLARERRSAFFVDDSHWNRGKWTDHFQAIINSYQIPDLGCVPPPPEELVACPRTSRHWVVSSQTASFHLGRDFSWAFEDRFGYGLNRRKSIFKKALRSFGEIIRPNLHTATLIHAARSEIASVLSMNNTESTQHHDPYIGVHLQGDIHAGKTSSQSDPPLDVYVKAAHDTWTRLYPDAPIPQISSDSKHDSTHFPTPPITYLASDSPDALREYIKAFPSSTAVFALDLSTNPELRALAPQHAYVQEDFAKESEEERIRLTRGAIVDLALLGGLWPEVDGVLPGAAVCSSSSHICKLAAVGLGWDSAFGFGANAAGLVGQVDLSRRRWIDVNPRIQAIITASWNAFDLPK